MTQRLGRVLAQAEQEAGKLKDDYVSVEHALLLVSIRDDGVGGADASRGSGLIGLQDRVETLGGTIEIAGGSGHGTTILASIPIDGKNEADD